MEKLKSKEVKPLKRLGFIKVSITGHPNENDLLVRKLLFEQMTPLSMEMDNFWHRGAMQKIFCYCEKFREIEVGEITPEYEVMFTRHSDETTTLDSITEIK
jgi:hypothetical protein